MFYEKYLNAKEIEARKKKYGFPNTRLIELLIYDYEVFRHLLELSDKFYLKGGAAAQLYMTLPDQRASKDIDLVTSHTPEEVEEIFEKKLNKVFSVRKHVPAKITHNLPMVTYLVEADSICEEGKKIEIKVDIIFEDLKNYKLTKAAPCEIFALDTEVELPAVSIGSLVGDKLLTLAQKSIGLPTEKLAEYPKQLYDIVRIMKKLDQTGFEDIIFSFQNLIKTELKIRNLENTPEEIISHIFEILDEFTRLDTEDCLFKKYVNDFQGAYVNKKARKTTQEWIMDSLLLIYLLKIIRDIVVKTQKIDDKFKEWSALLSELDKISELDIEEKKKLHQQYLDDLREKLPGYKRLKSASEQRLFLELRKLDGEQIRSLTDKLALDYLNKVETFEMIKSVNPEDRDKLKDIMRRFITEKLSVDDLMADIHENMPYIKPYLVKTIANNEPSKLYSLATLENLRMKGEKYCYVEPSTDPKQCKHCISLIDGRVFKIKTLQDNVYANYKTKSPEFPAVPLHPYCKHEVRGLTTEEKVKLPENIPDAGHPITF